MYSANRFHRSLLILAAIFLALAARADRRPELAIANIPDSLRAGANAVVRSDETTIRIEALDEVRVSHSRTVSLLNADAAGLRRLSAHLSSLQRIDALQATVYDAAGKVVTTVGKKMFRNMPLNIVGSDFSDIVLKTYEVSYSDYPFTIVFTEEKTLHHTFMLPTWSQGSLTLSDRIAVESATISVIALKSVGLRYKCMSGLCQPSRSGDTLKWSICGVPASRPEPFAAVNELSSPGLLLALDSCSVGGFSGSTHSWSSLGQFIYRLNSGRHILSFSDSSVVRKITDSVSDQRRIVGLLYKYVQARCRYVSVHPGIGGWQTLPAAFVGKNQYGDCKGLSNYLMGLLGAAGISSYPVLITAGEDYAPLVRDFANPRFNHEILCVPSGKDTLWLECTSSINEVGYLGNFTADRDALMITPEGGVLVHTPGLTEMQNYTRRNVAAEVSAEGSCRLHLKAMHSGCQHDQLCSHVLNRSNDDLSQFTSTRFALSGYTVDRFRFEKSAPREAIPAMSEEVDLRADGLVTRSASRYFVNLNLVPLDLPEPVTGMERKAAFRVPRSIAIEDEFELKLPDEATPESLPKPVEIRQDFGSFSCNVSYSGNALILHRRYVLKAGSYDPVMYRAYLQMRNAAAAASTYKAVMVAGKG